MQRRQFFRRDARPDDRILDIGGGEQSAREMRKEGLRRSGRAVAGDVDVIVLEDEARAEQHTVASAAVPFVDDIDARALRRFLGVVYIADAEDRLRPRWSAAQEG